MKRCPHCGTAHAQTGAGIVPRSSKVFDMIESMFHRGAYAMPLPGAGIVPAHGFKEAIYYTGSPIKPVTVTFESPDLYIAEIKVGRDVINRAKAHRSFGKLTLEPVPTSAGQLYLARANQDVALNPAFAGWPTSKQLSVILYNPTDAPLAFPSGKLTYNRF